MSFSRYLSKLASLLGSDGKVPAAGLATGAAVSNIGANGVTSNELASDAVTTAKIADANVTTAKIADSAITSAKIADATIATGDIADSAVTTAKIANANVTVAKISAIGTPSSTTYLRGDGAWSTVSGGVTSITAGNGLSGGTITSSGTISLDMYTGGSNSNTSYPIGSYLCSGGGTISGAVMNQNRTMYRYNSSASYYPTPDSASATALAGTWVLRGGPFNGCAGAWLPGALFQRIA